MAQGDVVGDTVSVAAAGALVIQPAVGVEFMIKAAGMDDVTASTVFQLTDGTSNAALFRGSEISTGNGQLNVPINNTDFCRMVNNTAGAITMGWRGVQIT